MGGLGWVRNKLRTYIIIEKKKLHMLDPLVGWFGKVEKKFDFDRFWRFRPGGTKVNGVANPGIPPQKIFFLARMLLKGHIIVWNGASHITLSEKKKLLSLLYFYFQYIDFISLLPFEIVKKILALIDSDTLTNLSNVSNVWKSYAEWG